MTLLLVNNTPSGPPNPTGGWSCVLAESFNSTAPPSGLFALNRNNAAGDNGLIADCGGFNQNDMEVFNASQTNESFDGMHLHAAFSPGHASPTGSSITGTATLSSGLTTHLFATSLLVSSFGGGASVFGGLPTGSQIVVMDPTLQHSQVFTLSAPAAGGATSLSVNLALPNYSYPAGSYVWGGTYLSACLSSQPTNPISGEAGFPITGFTFLPGAGITFAFEVVISLPAAEMPGGAMSFWARSGPNTNEIDFFQWNNYDQNLTGVWDCVASWIDHVHSTSSSGTASSNTYAKLSAQTDGQNHRWTTVISASDNKVHSYLDGVEIASMQYNWLAAWNTSNTDYLHLFLSHSLRNVYSGKGPTFTGYSDVIIRSVAVYQDTPHAGQNITGGGIAPGTTLVSNIGAPVVATVGANGANGTSAQLIGSVNPEGATATWWFEYGTTSLLGTSTSATALASGITPITVTYELTGLTPETTYYFAVAAQNLHGVVTSFPLSFISSAPTISAGSPTISLGTPPVNIPHFNFPFTLTFKDGVEGNAVVVEQGSLDEIAACVQAILACPIGACPQLSSFGITPLLFAQAPLNTQNLLAQILQWEPRATLNITANLLANQSNSVNIAISAPGNTLT